MRSIKTVEKKVFGPNKKCSKQPTDLFITVILFLWDFLTFYISKSFLKTKWKITKDSLVFQTFIKGNV